MSIFLVLDVLLVLLVVLFAPIGYWRGPVKELLVMLGVLAGVVLSDYWARPWGHDLSTQTSITADGGAFIVAMAFLVASTFILGYGLGATLAPAFHGLYARVLGGAVAALNSVLLLSYSLQYVRLFLLSDANERSLNDSFVARFLLDDIGYVLLIAALLAAPLLAYVLITGRRAYEIDDEYEYDDAYIEETPVAPRADLRRATAATQTLPPRVPSAPPAEPRRVYKAEPEPARRAPTDATRPLTVAEPKATAEPMPATSDAAARMGDTDPHIVIPAAARAPQPEPAQSEPAEAVADDDLAPGYARCRNCHAVLSPDTTICPNCGTLR
jgi:uncharacterized membrane protein required for colicin V production